MRRMVRLRFWIVLVIGIIGTPSYALGQDKDITESEYWDGIRSGYSSTRKSFPRVETKTYEGFVDGKVNFVRIEKFEFEATDRLRSITETVQKDKKSTSLMLQIGKSRYCQENEGEWKAIGCYDRPPAPLEGGQDTKYILRKNSNSISYVRTDYFVSGGPDGQKKILVEDIMVVNLDGTVRERSIVKSEYGTKSIRSRSTDKYSYGVKFDAITAPIK